MHADKKTPTPGWRKAMAMIPVPGGLFANASSRRRNGAENIAAFGRASIYYR